MTGRPAWWSDEHLGPWEDELARRNSGHYARLQRERDLQRRANEAQQSIAQQEARSRLLERQLHDHERESFVDRAVFDRRINDDQADDLRHLFDEDETAARAFVALLPKGEREPAQAAENAERAYMDDVARHLGIPVEELV